jgi:hypothetical protein
MGLLFSLLFSDKGGIKSGYVYSNSGIFSHVKIA